MDAEGRPVVAAARSSDQWYQMLLTYPTESGQLHHHDLRHTSPQSKLVKF